jgi:hypothetical protein
LASEDDISLDDRKSIIVLCDLCPKIHVINVFPIIRTYLIWIRHSLQASIASTHRHLHVQIVVLFFFFIILDYFSLFSISTYPVNSIAKEIFWAEVYRGRLFIRAEIYRGRHFLGAKQEGLTIVHFLNKLIVSCKEVVRVPF